jgi:hypothetical protein
VPILALCLWGIFWLKGATESWVVIDELVEQPCVAQGRGIAASQPKSCGDPGRRLMPVEEPQSAGEAGPAESDGNEPQVEPKEPGEGVLKGRLELTDGTPMRGVRIHGKLIIDEDPVRRGPPPWPPGDTTAETTTDHEGHYCLTGLRPGDYVIKISVRDLDSRPMEDDLEMLLHPAQSTRTPPRTWRFGRLDLETRFPVEAEKRCVDLWLDLPGNKPSEYLCWRATSWREQRSLPIQVGTRFAFSVEDEGGTWSRRVVTMGRGQIRRRILLAVPDSSTWVPLTVKLVAPDLLQSKSVFVEVLETVQAQGPTGQTRVRSRSARPSQDRVDQTT